jgi:hypothetical protein
VYLGSAFQPFLAFLAERRMNNLTYKDSTGGESPNPTLSATSFIFNRFVMRSLAGSVYLFTLMAARLNRGSCSNELAGAGHPPAMIVSRGRAPRLMESRSAILGLLEAANPRPHHRTHRLTSLGIVQKPPWCMSENASFRLKTISYLLWQRMYAVVFYPSIDSRTGGGSPTACNRLRLTADL